MHIPLLLFALLGPVPTTAFYPTKFRSNLSTTPGISHQQMTEEVLTAVAGSLFPPVVKAFEDAHGVPLSRGMLDARTAIVRANTRVGRRPGGEWHYDGEDDAASSRLLEGLRAGVVKDLAEGRVGWARANLGAALHLVQDYFANSDEIEESDDFEQRWRRDLLSQTTLVHDHSRGSSNDLGEQREGEPTWNDQQHQRRRAQTQQHGPGSDDWSSEFSQHLREVKWAKLASEAFIHNIAQYVPDRQLQHLFGVGLDSVVLVDPAAFTSPDWDDAREKIINMFRGSSEYSLQKNGANKFSAVSLLAPAPQKSFEWSVLEDQHVNDTLDDLQSVVSGDQTVCGGIGLESILSAIRQLEFGGELVLVVGQELQKDDILENLIFKLLADYPVAVTIIQLETECGEVQTYSLVQNMADLSNGAYITDLDAHQTLTFPRDGNLVAQSGLGVIQVNSNYNSTSQSNITFLVDGTMDRLVITADWFAADTPNPLASARFYDPGESNLQPVTMADGETHRAVWKIEYPMPGEWGFTFGDESVPPHNITIKGRSSIQLVDVSFVEVAGAPGHEGYFPILQDVLAAETEVGVVGEVYGLFHDEYQSVEWFIVDAVTGAETQMLMAPGLDPMSRPGYADQNTFFGVTTLPQGDFYVVVRGMDALGYGFQRSLPWTTSARYYADRTYNISDADSVAKFLRQEDESESGPGEVVMPRGLMRQTVTGTAGSVTRAGTGTAPSGQFTSPFGTPVTPADPFFTNATGFPDTGATTANANTTATSPVLPTSPTSDITPATSPSLSTLPTSAVTPFSGPRGFSTSVPIATISALGATDLTSLAGSTIILPLSVPTSLDLSSSALVSSYTSFAVSSSVGHVVFNSVSAAAETESPVYVLTKSVTVTEPCGWTEAPSGQTAGALPDAPDAPQCSACAGCKNCGEQTPFIIEQSPVASSPSVSYQTILVPPKSATDAAHPVPHTKGPAAPVSHSYTSPESPPIIATVEVTITTKRTTTIPAVPAAPTQGACEQVPPSPDGSFTPAQVPAPAPSLASKSSGALGPGYGPVDYFSTASANGTFGGQTTEGHTGHTASSSQETSSSEETDPTGETVSGKGVKGVRAEAVAGVVVAVSGMVFLIL